MEHAHARQDGKPSRPGDPSTFSGQVMMDALLTDSAGDTPAVRVNNVAFEPGARTFWHSHSGGQVLLVSTGRGMVQNRDGHRHVLRPGDLVWAPPGEEHWHGAAPDSAMAHTAVSLGETRWLGEVAGDRYDEAFGDE